MKQQRFGSYDQEFKLLADTLPMLVSVTKNPNDETKEQFSSTHDKFILLSDIIKDKLAAPETATKIQTIGKNHNLTLIQMSDIARTIRSYYFGEIKLEDIAPALAREIPIDIVKAREIARIVIEKIINDDSQEQAYQTRLENITIQDALHNYPELGEQLITAEKIVLKTFHEPVRPSIKNWLADYTFTMGHETKSAIERGNYLFQSINGRRLSSGERQKLAFVLKAFDENSAVTVDKNAKQIVFPAVNVPRDKSNMSQISNSEFRISNQAPISNDLILKNLENSELKHSKLIQNSKLEIKNSAPKRDFVRNDSYQIAQLKENTVKTEPHNENKQATLRDTRSTIRENIKFSSPQRLPFEKEKEQRKETDAMQPPAKPAIPAPAKPQLAQYEPLRIRPFSMGRKEDGTPSKNVVNLKEE